MEKSKIKMEVITSKSNPKIVDAKKLLEKKYRDKTNLFLVETKKVIFEALQCGLNIKFLFVQEDKQSELNNFDSNVDNNKIFIVSKSVFKELSSVVSPDGYVAVFEKPISKKEYLGGRFLILDNLQNPDNFGAILRTALASNFTQIFVINSVDEFSPKVIRASMGNQFKLKIIQINYDEVPKLFLSAKLYVMSMEGKNLFEIDSFCENIGFVIGNEGNGVSQFLKDMATETLSIPMENNVESLNASVSASIVMYHIYSKDIKKQ